MKNGSHLGALGALMNNVDNFIGKDGLVKEDPAIKEEATKE